MHANLAQKCESAGVKFLKHTYRFPGSKSKSTSKLAWNGYADDIVLYFEDDQSLETGLRLLDEVFSSYHLKINVAKTKTSFYNAKYESRPYPSSIDAERVSGSP